MAGIGFNLKAARGNFFDAKLVIRAVSKADRKVMSRFGSYVMTRARRSIKKAPTGRKVKGMSKEQWKAEKKRRQAEASAPVGKPPYLHVGTLRKGIFFAYEPAAKNVVIGPILSAGSVGVPHALEYGGRSRVTGGPDEGKAIKIEPRPFMGPAFAGEIGKVAGWWKDQVR